MLSGQKVDFVLSLLALFCYWDSATPQSNTGPPAPMSAPHGLGELIRFGHEKHIPQCPGQYGDIPLLWGQGAEMLPAPLISSGEHDGVHPDPPRGDSPSLRSVPGEWPWALPQAGLGSSQSPKPPQALGFACRPGLEKGEGKHRSSEMPQNITASLRSALVTPCVPALAKGACSRGGCTSLLSVTAWEHDPAH